MKRTDLFLLSLLILLILFFWCFFTFNKIDKVVLKLNRFDQELFSINKNNIVAKTTEWEKKFYSFNEVFSTQIMQVNHLNREEYHEGLLALTNDKDMREAYDSVCVLFSDFSDVHTSLELAFGRVSSVLPSYPMPEITTFFGGFNFGVVTYDNNIGIGLENFLGQDSKYYKYLGDPKYLRFQKQKRFICANVMEVWFNEYFSKYLEGRDLLSQIIYKGKMMYFLDKMLPELPMEDKFRFTNNQMNWVQENEVEIWEYLIHEDLLFSSKESEFRSLINYAPYAKGMPKEAPARIAYFVGYKMVSDYMKNNKIDIEDLLRPIDSKDFMRLSKYKPTK